jgi:outer membrane lipoprotein LolB
MVAASLDTQPCAAPRTRHAIHRRSVVFLGGALALLVGCATVTPPEGTAPTSRLSGRLGVTVQDAPGRSFSAGFELEGDARQGRLVLSSALGLQLGEARWSPSGAELITADGRRTYASPEDMADELIGEPIPLQALPDWLRGRPWAGAAHVDLPVPEQGFIQEGWRIDRTDLAHGRLTALHAQPAPAITVRARLDPP